VLVRDVMARDVARIGADATFGEAARRFREVGWSELAVTADDDTLEGVLALGDVLRALVPDVRELARAGAALDTAFAAFLDMGRRVVDQPVGRLVIRDPIVVAPADPLLRAAAVMISRHIHRLFVVDRGRVIGTIGRADIVSGALSP
jgi:MFS transporter, DHA2 family, lincomycin resistance protein